MLVDERMRTSDPHILAAGDVAEHAGRVHGLWPVAVEQAEVAADNAVGGDKAYVGSIPFTMLKVVGVELTSVGRFEEQAGRRGRRDRGARRQVPQARDRGRPDRRRDPARLLGQEVAAVRTAINRGFHVGGVMDALRAGRWDALAELSGERPLLAGAPTGAGWRAQRLALLEVERAGVDAVAQAALVARAVVEDVARGGRRSACRRPRCGASRGDVAPQLDRLGDLRLGEARPAGAGLELRRRSRTARRRTPRSGTRRRHGSPSTAGEGALGPA